MLRRHWIVVSALVIGFPFFFIGGPGYLSPRSYKTGWDMGHIIFFALASLVLCEYWGRRSSRQRPVLDVLRVFSSVFIFGIMVELAQMSLDGRHPDLFDVLRDMLGACVGCVFFCDVRRRCRPGLLRGLQVVVVLLLICAVAPLAAAVFDEQTAARQFPLLADFETPFELNRWHNIDQLQRVDAPVRHGSHAMRVQLSTKKYSGVGLFYFPHDWSGYARLHFSVYNPEPINLPLHSRIHDQEHEIHHRVYADRFHRKFDLHPGWNDLQISLDAVQASPADREMDMHNIEGFGIFVVSQARPLVLYVDYVYLSQ